LLELLIWDIFQLLQEDQSSGMTEHCSSHSPINFRLPFFFLQQYIIFNFWIGGQFYSWFYYIYYVVFRAEADEGAFYWKFL